MFVTLDMRAQHGHIGKVARRIERAATSMIVRTQHRDGEPLSRRPCSVTGLNASTEAALSKLAQLVTCHFVPGDHYSWVSD